jgi:hypothetical protein
MYKRVLLVEQMFMIKDGIKACTTLMAFFQS